MGDPPDRPYLAAGRLGNDTLSKEFPLFSPRVKTGPSAGGWSTVSGNRMSVKTEYSQTPSDTPQAFSHEALFYAGLDDFVGSVSAFIREGLETEEPILVVVGSAKLGLLREELGSDAHQVRFADMANVGFNPARIIPAWREFVNEHGPKGKPFRGIGEPIWADRPPPALIESQRHESLLNLAFHGAPHWRLLCPYDTDTLATDVIEEAYRSHPLVWDRGMGGSSPTYMGLEAATAPFDKPLPDPPERPEVFAFDRSMLPHVRETVRNQAARFGFDAKKANDLVVAVNEVATNSLQHGGGEGLLRVWTEQGSLICEIRDRGRIDRPLLGRERPGLGQDGGLGVWLANQLCDLVQIRTFPEGSVVRLHMSRV